MLDLATAKFAAGSIEARRSAPFRRLMEVVADDARERHRFTDASHGSDFMFGFMLGYTGQTSQLPDHKAEFGAINEMIYPATSKYVPAPVVLSIALGEMGAFEQSVHHTGYEIYSRSPSFLVSAGGVQTPSATPGKLGFINVGERCVDRGAALPTVLIPSSVGYAPTNPAVVRDDLLRIDGFYYNYETEGTFCSGGSRETAPPAPPAKLMWSHDHNLCVYKGFACGTNIVIPPALETCFTPATGRWRFLDSSKCPALPGTKPFYVTVYRRPCPSEAENCLHNWGFFEAVEAMDSACIATSNNPATCFRTGSIPTLPRTLLPPSQNTKRGFWARISLWTWRIRPAVTHRHWPGATIRPTATASGSMPPRRATTRAAPAWMP